MKPFIPGSLLCLMLTISAAYVRADKLVTVGDQQNGSLLTLHRGQELVVRLQENPSTGYLWAPVLLPSSFLSYKGSSYGAGGAKGVVGAPGLRTFRFKVTGSASFSRGVYQKFLLLRAFEPGLNNPQVFEVRVEVPAGK